MFKRFNAKHLYLKVSQKIKNFLLNANSREFLIFLFFLIIASGFWLLQTLDNEYETDLTIPVKLRGIPENAVITSEPVSDVHIKVKDRGNVLLNYKLRSRFLPVIVDFNEYQKSGSHVKIYSSDFERKIASQLSGSTRLLEVYPDTLEYIYTTGESKKVPVYIDGRITSARQYYLSDTILTPDSVLVYAPLHLLDTIRKAYTTPIELLNITDTTTVQLTISPVKGAKFDPQQVQATFATDMYTEKTVEVPLVGVNFPAGRVLRTFPSKVQVTFQVGMGHFKDITADDFLISVSYEELLKLPSDVYTVKLKVVPSNVSVIRIVPDKVDFLIEQYSSDES